LIASEEFPVKMTVITDYLDAAGAGSATRKIDCAVALFTPRNVVFTEPAADRIMEVPPPLEDAATVIATFCTSGRTKLALK